MKTIERPKSGEPINKLWQKVSELVDAVNALQNLKVTPETAGRFVPSEGNIVLQLNTTDQCP